MSRNPDTLTPRDRRRRNTFWIDDRVIDEFAPVMGRYPFGAAALAVYAVLARRADRDGDSWPSLGLIANESGSSTRTVHKALRLLELLGLVEIAVCYERGSRRQTSHLYTLRTPPERPPRIDPDPSAWPPPTRRTLLITGGGSDRTRSVAAARLEQSARGVAPPSGAAREPRAQTPTPRRADTLPPAPAAPPPCTPCTLPPATVASQKGNPREGNTTKESSSRRNDGETRDGCTQTTHDSRLTTDDSSPSPFVIPEIGLTNRQVWAATIGELARRGDVSRTELESWLRPAALIARDGATLVIGAPNAVTRDRIATRLLPAVRAALVATIGAPVRVAVEVMENAGGAALKGGDRGEGQGASRHRDIWPSRPTTDRADLRLQ
jgi:hypothetical protein